MSLRIGETFAGYRILKLIGSGGMGEVYLVEHPRLPRQDVLKALRPDVSTDASFRDRFIREADLAAGLRHPHIVGVQDRGEHDGQMWIAMDYIEGTDAAQLLQQRYPAGMPVELVATIVTAVANALDYAHSKGLLHRDVKPANIIVTEVDGGPPRVYLADFGIARPLDDTGGLTATNMTVGTVAYAAPEQLMAEPMDGRADQYALAATAYQLLTGSQLFPHSNAAVVISHHLNAPAPALADTRPELAALDPVLAAALSKEPDNRFACCADFAHALAETGAAQGSRGVAAPTTPAPVARKPRPATTPPNAGNAAPVPSRPARSAKRWWLIGASIAASLLVLAAAGALWKPWEHPQSTTSAIASSQEPSAAAAIPTLPAAAPPVAAPPVATPPTHTPVTLPMDSYGSVHVRTVSGRTLCVITAGDVECNVHFTRQLGPPENGMPVSGVGINSRGTFQWLYGDAGNPEFVTMAYGTVYNAIGWTITPTSAGTTFMYDTTGHGMTVTTDGFTTF
ncbi:serine/threonine-protein kinase [Mycolicibacterium llatzerense]|uniref:serine/threonine-protein kinase n=1 Tax=Mycolicibacterium llatzerense TaxID=280871 RepID=UPI0021B5CDE3|nr:serine/threonine-protein kinase [Mycolicibacterium llatzerense]MCT7372638.1 hypothetical protein [Mycolicibacterium llatzerense]